MLNEATLCQLEARAERVANRPRPSPLVKRPDQYPTNPIAYCHDILGVTTLTQPQQEILHHLTVTPRRVLVPSAHDVGKCVAEDEWLTLADGRRVRAGDLVGQSFLVLTLSPLGFCVPAVAHAAWNATEPVWELTTETGRRIVRNAHHPLWAADVRRGAGVQTKVIPLGWRGLASIEPGQHVAVAQQLPAFGLTPMPEEDVRLLAYMIGDGGMTTSGLTFTQQDNQTLARFREAAAKKDCVLVPRPSKTGYDYRVVGRDRRRRAVPNRRGGVTHHRVNPLHNLLSRHGMTRKHSRDKFIPAAVWALPDGQQRLFLSCLYSTDGWASLQNGGHPEIGYCSVSERLCRDVQEMLLRFGVHAYLFHKPKVNAWVVAFWNADDIIRFAGTIGIEDKADAVARVRAKATTTTKTRHAWRSRHAIPGTRWERVESVRQLDVRRTVAVEVPGHHTFLTQFWEHNTFVAACAACWWFDQWNPGLVLTTAPTERDVIDLLWTEIRSLWGRAGQERPFVGPKAPEVYDHPQHYAKGYVSRLGQGFQGRHQPHMLFIKDEANDIPSLQWIATRTMFDPSLGHSELAIFNPVSATSHAYLEDCACDEPGGELRWHRIRLSALDHPNIQHEYATGGKLIRGAVGVDMLEAWVNDWTDPVQPGDERPTDIQFPPERPCPCCRRENP